MSNQFSRLIDLTGQKFQKWTIAERAPNSFDGKTQWHCICDCGNKGIVQSYMLRNGLSKGCTKCKRS